MTRNETTQRVTTAEAGRVLGMLPEPARLMLREVGARCTRCGNGGGALLFHLADVIALRDALKAAGLAIARLPDEVGAHP